MSNNTTPETLEVKVHEDIITGDTMGTFSDTPKEAPVIDQSLMDEAKRLSMEDYMRKVNESMGRYVPGHNKPSRWVTIEDLPRVVAEGKVMLDLMHLPRGKYSTGVAALAHSQIEDQDPLRFFVLPNGMVVINPVVTSHSKAPVYKTEGCMSYPDEEMKTMVPRFNIIEVGFQLLEKQDESEEPKLSKMVDERLNGHASHIFQHEISHVNGHNVYDEDYSPDFCVGMGDGKEITWEAAETAALAPKTE